MTYEEALVLKSKIGETINEKGVIMKVFVAPKSSTKIGEYCDYYRHNNSSFKDSHAKMYCEDNEYICMGLHYDHSSEFVLSKPIYGIQSIS